MRNQAPAIELGEDAAQTDLLLQDFEAFGNRVRCANQRVVAQAILVAQAA